MKTFLQWAKDNNREVIFDEKTLRTGLYPAAIPKGYVRSQYPDAYFMPGLSNAALAMKQQDTEVKDKAPPDNAP